MSKQDGFAPRTPADLQRQYRFGRTFDKLDKEVDEAQKSADNANKSLNDLDQKKIFSLLTSNGTLTGLYMGVDGNIYFTANNVVGGKLKAAYIDTDNLFLNSTNITGRLASDQLPDDTAKTSDIPTKTSELENDSEFVNKEDAATIATTAVETTADGLIRNHEVVRALQTAVADLTARLEALENPPDE
jgi:hypothetical protein